MGVSLELLRISYFNVLYTVFRRPYQLFCLVGVTVHPLVGVTVSVTVTVTVVFVMLTVVLTVFLITPVIRKHYSKFVFMLMVCLF